MTDETRGAAVNGRTAVTERRQAAGGTPRRAAVARPARARPATRPAVRPGGARPAAAPPVPRRGQAAPPGTPRAAGAPQPGRRPRHPAPTRTRFVFLVVGLLGGGLLCLLMINTILATGAFQITALQQGNVALAQREQALQAQVAAEESPGTLAQRAESLGMRIQPRLYFLNLRRGRLESQPSQLRGMPAVTAPGYTP